MQLASILSPAIVVCCLGFASYVLCWFLPRLPATPRSTWIPVVCVYASLLFLVLWCFISAIVTHEAEVTADMTLVEMEQGRPLSYVCEGVDGQRKWCSTCKLYKPDRAHHCRETSHCVLKYDHYCPWIGGIVGFARYKFFYQFVWATFLYSIYVLVVCAWLVGFEHDARIYVALGIAAFWTIMLATFVSYHTRLILLNLSTFEAVRSRYPYISVHMGDKRVIVESSTNPFFLSYYKNWKQVMGNNFLDWFLPLHKSPGNGVSFEFRELVPEGNCS